MARATKVPIDPDDAPLKRLGGGRWQSRDERFTIEPQSGTWVVVDGEQIDDLGMALVRGPFPSLTAAKEAIGRARSSVPAASPLAGRIERRRREPHAEPRPNADAIGLGKTSRASSMQGRHPRAGDEDGAETGSTPGRPRAASRDRKPVSHSGEEPPEPGWLTDLEPGERGRARRLIARLRADDVPDAEGLVRRDLVGDVPALAAQAIAHRLGDLGDDASPRDVA
ncbi:MAG TPA: hypothetical protein VHM48_05875, partial [Candidatus Limnocylindrales bacterium]|nr:hypothetical protein [Candidatus Limnocylindrales bacterium]